jgi:hypothetical protein
MGKKKSGPCINACPLFKTNVNACPSLTLYITWFLCGCWVGEAADHIKPKKRTETL